jgi:Rrf2 family cysteine metabolism transcriptional repressor
MRISSKGRYGLAAAVLMAREYVSGAQMTVAGAAENLGISKIYLEQVFSQLKKAGIVVSSKGAQGGYRLTRPPQKITAFEVLSALEQSLFEKTEQSVAEKAADVERAMQESVFSAADRAVCGALAAVSLSDLAAKADQYRKSDAYMFYI